MYTKAPYQLAIIIGVALLASSCAYIDTFRQKANYQKIENDITISSLEETMLFIGRAPLSKAYVFRFNTSQNHSFSLLFSIHESSFSDSTLKYLRGNNLYRNADQVDNSIPILIALHKNLPPPNEVPWRMIEQLPSEEAQDGYEIMLDYIKFKIRDS